jgi:hypothetical protein
MADGRLVGVGFSSLCSQLRGPGKRAGVADFFEKSLVQQAAVTVETGAQPGTSLGSFARNTS